MGNRVVICHWNNGGGWDAIEISTSALGGHDQHERDIWPPIEGVSDGQNWEQLGAVWDNGCRIEATPSPSPSPTSSSTASPSPSATLPDTGPAETAAMALTGLLMIAVGAWLKWRSLRV